MYNILGQYLLVYSLLVSVSVYSSRYLPSTLIESRANWCLPGLYYIPHHKLMVIQATTHALLFYYLMSGAYRRRD